MQKTTRDSVTISNLLGRQTSMIKHLLLLTVSLALTVAHGQTSVYHPFPDSNAVWGETTWGVSAPLCGIADNYFLFINGDTIIGANTYHKIYTTGKHSAQCPPSSFYYYNVYRGALRQDTLQKKVYYAEASNSNESLLYDFNLNVGDTLPQTFNGGSFHRVSKIDSALVGSNYHKRFILQPLSGTYPYPDTTHAIIEGIGSTFGLYNLMGYFTEVGGNLICFAFNSATYPTNSSCIITTQINEAIEQKNQIKTFPNPFSAQTTLQTADRLQNASLTVYNSVGQTVKHIDNLSGQTLIFHRDNLPSGLYFVRLAQDGNTISADKFVITDK